VRCDFADSLLQGYFDGELSSASAVEFERHLQQCTHCPVELVDMDLLSERLQIAQLYESAPASLRKKIRANLRPRRGRDCYVPASPLALAGRGGCPSSSNRGMESELCASHRRLSSRTC